MLDFDPKEFIGDLVSDAEETVRKIVPLCL